MSVNNKSKNPASSSNTPASHLKIARKPFYQFFSTNVIVTAMVIVSSFIFIFWLLSQQYQKVDSVITNELEPQKIELMEQRQLLKAHLLLEELLVQASFTDLAPTLNKLVATSKNLSLLNTDEKKTYQRWVNEGESSISLLNEVEAQHPNNQLLKSNMLILLDTLIDAIDLELTDGDVNREQRQILTQAQNVLMGILLNLNSLTLESKLSDFVLLSEQIKSLFDKDFGKQLATEKSDNEKVEEIVKDFLRFEDLIVKRGVLSRWRSQLELLNAYQLQLIKQKDDLTGILELLASEDIQLPEPVNLTPAFEYHKLFSIPLITVCILFFAMFIVLVLLYILFYRIKIVTKLNVTRIIEALNGSKSFSLALKSKPSELSAESAEIIQSAKVLSESSFSQSEYLALKKKNTVLIAQLEKSEIEQEELYNNLAPVKENEKLNLVLDQACLDGLQLAAIKQLVHTGASVISDSGDYESKTAIERNEINQRAHDQLYDAFIQGRYLVRKLRQINYYQYLQSGDAIQTLSEVHLGRQLCASLFNFHNKLQSCKNTVSMNIDKKVNQAVKLDIELFSEMINVFISLAFAQKTRRHLTLNLVLIDTAASEQQLLVTADLSSEEEPLSLPKLVKNFPENSEGNNKILDYFLRLLTHQEGSEPFVKTNKKGYQLGFNLPVKKSSFDDNSNASTNTLAPYPQVIDGNLAVSEYYFTMPIEVLIAVQDPFEYKLLQQILHELGLQTTFVTSELILKSSWKSGRYAILMTDMKYNPFVTFMVDELIYGEKSTIMPRGVINLSLDEKILLPSEGFNHWVIGALTSDSGIEDTMKVMQPWIKARTSSEQKAPVKGKNDISTQLILNRPLIDDQQPEFDIEQYVKNQGSVELALFMLDEYVLENNQLTDKLEDAFYNHNTKQVDNIIQKLRINSTILGAENLLADCQCWQKIVEFDSLDKTDKAQIELLHKTQKSVECITQFADKMV